MGSSDHLVRNVLDHLEGVERHNGHYRALCPGHPDRNTPNLSITEKKHGTVLVHCFVCKDQERVLRALPFFRRRLWWLAIDSSGSIRILPWARNPGSLQ